LSIFDRQIQNMEFNRNWGQGAAGIAAAAGTVAGGVAGAALGSLAGGIGAIPGAVLGAAGGALTGGADVASNWIIQNEAIDYTKDLFEFQVGNIKAIPQGLARTAAHV
jgi:ABC-type Co2+ transport system permease subunit